MESRTARLTVLIDPKKKQLFDEICTAQDLTPSQVVRKLIGQYVIDHAGSRGVADRPVSPSTNSDAAEQ
jgi:hypothetical protein